MLNHSLFVAAFNCFFYSKALNVHSKALNGRPKPWNAHPKAWDGKV